MNIIIAPIHETFFSGRIWMGLDIVKIKEELERKRPDCRIQIIDFAAVAADYSLLPQNALLFYTVSYNEDYQQYIKDVILDLTLSRKDVLIMPNLDQLFAFENKGYQELLKNRLGIEMVKGNYYGDTEDFYRRNGKNDFPFVYKKLKGAMSSGVRLINSKNEFDELDKQNKVVGFLDKLRLLKKLLNKDKDKSLHPVKKYSDVNFVKFFSKRTPFVVQEFVPHLKCDYKVLAFGDKYFVLQRKVRPDDFKASGSGLFEWVEPSVKLLNYAMEIIQKMNVPFNSLDIVETDDFCALVEFQGSGFGPLTLIGASYYYKLTGDKWEKINAESDLEEEYAYAIAHYLYKHEDN